MTRRNHFGPVVLTVSSGDVDDLQRDDLVGFAAINHQIDAFAADEATVRLPLGVQRIAAGGANGLARLGGSAKFEIVHMLVRKRLGDNLDDLAGGWGKFTEPGDPATLFSAVAKELDLDDVPALKGTAARSSIRASMCPPKRRERNGLPARRKNAKRSSLCIEMRRRANADIPH